MIAHVGGMPVEEALLSLSGAGSKATIVGSANQAGKKAAA